MVVLFRRLFFFLLQLSGITAAVVVGCAAWALSERGMSYAETLAFRDDLRAWAVIGAVVAGFVCLVLLCWHATRGALESPDDHDDPRRY